MPDTAARDTDADQLAQLVEKMCAHVRAASAHLRDANECEQEIAALVTRMERE